MDTSAYILSLADRCVKCGLCLPQCPTYQLAANENESPRGRLALIQGWLGGQLVATETLTQHLDQCLLCRRCERVCPSQVPYAEIMDESKALLTEKNHSGFSLHAFVTKNSLRFLLNKPFSRFLFSALHLLQKTGLIFIAQQSGLLKLLGLQRLASYLPPLDKTIKTKNFYPARHAIKGNVALFTGCISKQLDAKTVAASINLLTRLGYGVYVPEQQVCCGALHLHDGEKTQAKSLAGKNAELFNQYENITAIVSLVNGCTSQLKEYPQLDASLSYKHEVKDMIEFLADANWPEEVILKPLNKRVALQIPCSLQNSLRAEDKLLTLLKRIPGIHLPHAAIYQQCCGAAGSYFLRFPLISEQLKDKALDKLEQISPKLIISSNLGCALQLKSGLAQRNQNIHVIHPVLLLEQQLQSP